MNPHTNLTYILSTCEYGTGYTHIFIGEQDLCYCRDLLGSKIYIAIVCK